MRWRDISMNRTYTAKVSGRVVPVRIERIYEYFDARGRRSMRAAAVNTTTGRPITIRSPQRLREEVSAPQDPTR